MLKNMGAFNELSELSSKQIFEEESVTFIFNKDDLDVKELSEKYLDIAKKDGSFLSYSKNSLTFQRFKA